MSTISKRGTQPYFAGCYGTFNERTHFGCAGFNINTKILLIHDELLARIAKPAQAESALAEWYTTSSQGAAKVYNFFRPRSEAKA